MTCPFGSDKELFGGQGTGIDGSLLFSEYSTSQDVVFNRSVERNVILCQAHGKGC
jgi:hypothetical protein